MVQDRAIFTMVD